MVLSRNGNTHGKANRDRHTGTATAIIPAVATGSGPEWRINQRPFGALTKLAASVGRGSTQGTRIV
jgi:hypothetical protein